MKQIAILLCVLAVACFLARPDSARRDVSQDEAAGFAPFFLNDSSTHATDPDSSTRATDLESSAQATDSHSPPRATDALGLAIFEMEGERYEDSAEAIPSEHPDEVFRRLGGS